MASHTFTRQELYDLVWSEPMIKLAARYNISGNGLAKACRKADIPVPERGYWNKVHAGRRVAKKPLPAATARTLSRITISPPVPLPEQPPPPPPPPSITERIEAERKGAKPLMVPATLSSPHRIIAAWLEEDRRQAQARRHDPYLPGIHTRIDKTDLDKRRLRILSALFKAIEARGYKLSVDDRNYRQEVTIESADGKLGIDIHERIRQVRRRITDEDRADKRRYFSVNQTWTQEKIPTGDLVLTIGGNEWSDGPESLLETKLDDVLPNLAGAFEELRLRREREAEEQARRWKAEQERQRAAMERKKETIRFRRLLGRCEDWRAAADIRAFVAAVEASPLTAARGEEFAGWKTWALGHADRIDPLLNEETLNRHVGDYETYGLKED